MTDSTLQSLSDTVRGLLIEAGEMIADAPPKSQLAEIVRRREFRPAEDESIARWFARFLNTRELLWTVIEDVLQVVEAPDQTENKSENLQFFLVGYAALCTLIRVDRVMLFDVAHHSTIQRKLNEAFPEYGIPRKQYTTIFSSFVDYEHVFAMRDAIRYARKNRAKLLALDSDPVVGYIARNLPQLETSLNPSKLSHIRRAWSYVSHKWRRRGVVSAQNILAGVFEGVGRTASEFYNATNKSVSAEVRNEIGEFLEPGDVIVTRHAKALTNLFFPGFWPHVALYVGTEEQRSVAGIRVTPDIEQKWVNNVCVLEARKDGVRLRPLSDTLSVDVFAVIRPRLQPDSVSQAITHALQHEGKLYNFDFDFFNSDKVVCTELVYRSYDGLEGLEIPLQERAGRKTLSAEDLLDFALATDTFIPVAIFGFDGCRNGIAFGDEVRALLEGSYTSLRQTNQ